MQYQKEFQVDDYEALNTKYFKKLRERKDMIADPSGWTDTHSNIGNIHSKLHDKLHAYNTDIANQLSEKKKFIIDLLSEWDASAYTQDNITLCHSTTVGSVIVLALLITRGIKTIIFETPNYFATLNQAERMGFNIIRIPTYYRTGFKFDLESKIVRNNSPCVIWLTQPRTALGMNQNIDAIKEIFKKISSKDYVVIDEATEQFFPSVLSFLNPFDYPNVIKIRSMFKGLGVNGIRLAYIIHHNSLRSEISDEMEIFQGALDVYSIDHAVELSKDISRFKIMLSVANEQVIKLYHKAKQLLLGTKCEISSIENGYIGSAIIHFDKSHSYDKKRIKFVEYCARKKVPVILGSAMGFARHPGTEFIRLNYFNRDYNILQGLRVISLFN